MQPVLISALVSTAFPVLIKEIFKVHNTYTISALPSLITLFCSLLLMIFTQHTILYDWTEIQNNFWKTKTEHWLVIHFSRVAALVTPRWRVGRGKMREISPLSTWALQECCSTAALKKQPENTATNERKKKKKNHVPVSSSSTSLQITTIASCSYCGVHMQDHKVKLHLSSPLQPTERECKTPSNWRAADFPEPVSTKNQEKHLTSQSQPELHFGFFKHLQIKHEEPSMLNLN